MLPSDKMPEAEVTLRLAVSLIMGNHIEGDVVVAIDGAHVKTGERVHFPIVEFLNSLGWHGDNASARWQCTYQHPQYEQAITVHSLPGEGDLVAKLANGQILRVESKKGPLSRNKSSQEYPIMREAIGQLMTIETVNQNDILAVAVPHSDKFAELACRWRTCPLITSAGINIVTVARDNKLRGLESVGI